jgi:hypothetical protein
MLAWLGLAGAPERRYTAAVTGSPGTRGGTITSSRHMLGVTGGPDARDANSGVAVAMDKAGKIVDVILLGDADFYV